MKLSLLLGAFGSLAAATALWQQTVPTALRGHVDTLNAAQSLTAKLTVTPVGGAAEEMKLTCSKPNLWKVETAGGFHLFDGKKVYSYDAAKKTYTETEAAGEAGVAALTMPEAWAWTAFFTPAGFKDVTGATRGKTQKIRGMDLTVMPLTFDKPDRSCTLYMDDKMGIARGLSFKAGDKDFIAFATEITLAKEPIAETAFAFTAPEGATKSVAPVTPTSSYKEVQAIFNRSCMPCHNATNHRGNYNLSSYEAVMASPGAVNVDHPEESFIVRSLKGDRAQRMPYNKAPLPNAQIQAITEWIKNGAKNE